ncbi:sigma-54 dependent transcriptional regulator [Erythrobacter sp. LQ02-29]|uniref:sigma-54-dependent transcriptional regulator n=1 Tax=Erythrobacter sp. LQ02-29 TaxID=2920384 RepID=UPI001F4EA398|nr:sigma-54 dependent transcriptional regulator [Erythrobacter sp. LQ02-29]MCP9221203.1 sigma-54 dependent transcriptional regulator [Erythrobacter sp. LQ02-29]
MVNSVLIVEDSASIALGYAAQLQSAGHKVDVAETLADAKAALRGGDFDVVLLDLQLPDGNGMDLLSSSASGGKPAPAFIIVTADGSLARAIDAMRLGAYDFLVKPVAGERLLTTVRNAAERGRSARKAQTPKSVDTANGYHGFIGKSPAMQQVYEAIENIASSKATVFVTGESGTGKEVTAEAIHAAGARGNGPFVAINCGAIPESLLESELFGHVKGAFTGAVENRIGAAKAADGGTLFLDELCEMELKLQVKLLRFLQTATVQPVGSSKVEPVDVRIVCATNRDPIAEVAAGRFREDLFYRLNVIPLELPPLRARAQDVQLIAEQFMARFGKEEGRELTALSEESRAALYEHPWPGNVRELQNTVRRAVVVGSGPILDLALQRHPGAPAQQGAPASEGQPNVATSSALVAEKHPVPQDVWEGMTLNQIERMAIHAAIERCGGNITKAAKALDVGPSTIYRKLEKWGAAIS